VAAAKRRKKTITAQEIVQGAKYKIPHYRLRMMRERTRTYPVEKVGGTMDLVKIARMEIADSPHEEIIVIGLNNANVPLGVSRVSQGGIGGAAVMATDILRPLITMGATGFVVAHNHPSGDPRPSRDDYLMTEALERAAKCINIPLYDHIVVAGRGGGWERIKGGSP
jgi:DNA repair protein RadC